MPIQPIVSIDDGGMKRKLASLAAKAGVTIQFVMWDQLRLWTQDVMKKTAPTAKADGLKKVAAGMSELFEPAETTAAFVFWKDRLAKQNSDVVQYTKTGKMILTKKSAKAESVSQMRKIHKAARTKGGGVSRKKVNRTTPDIAFKGKIIVYKSEYKKMKAELNRKVGHLKAGWVPALTFWAGKAKAPVKIPAYVLNQSKIGYAGGSIDEKGNGSIEAVNNVVYSNRRLSQDNVVELTKQGRQRDLTKGAFKRMDDLAKRFNAGRV
jgi:hypothetical protein